MSCTTETYALSLGNDLPVSVTLTTKHGATLTGRTVTAYLALTEGGLAVTDPVTTVTLTEVTTTPATARVYRGTIDAAVVDAVIALAPSAAWLAISVAGDLLVWERVPVVRHRRAT
jgi:hypothetical protein